MMTSALGASTSAADRPVMAPAGSGPSPGRTLIDLLRDAADAWGEMPALSIRAGLREDVWSYRRLWNASDAVAAYLAGEAGLRPGERVIVWGPNCPQLVATYAGVMLARLIPVPIDPYSSADFLRRVVGKTEAAALIAGFTPPEVGGLPALTLRLHDLPFDSGRHCDGECPAAGDLAEIVFTSGTTGHPKGVILTHANIMANVESARGLLPVDPGDRLLSILPLSHMLEQTIGLFVPLTRGATVCYPTSRQSPAILKALRRDAIDLMIVVPQVLTLLLAGIEREARRQGKLARWRRAQRLAGRLPVRLRRLLFADVHRRLGGRLRLFICGGAHLPAAVADVWERMGVTVLEGYGTTECAPVIATNSWWVRRPGTVGRPIPGVEVRLSNDGEILVRGANVTPGYWRDEPATRAAFTPDGWYRTGDTAEQDAGGFLTLRSRLKDVIVLPSGLKVFPEDVEGVLATQPGIADCVVLGLPDPDGSPHVHAVILPAATTNGAAPPALSDAVRAANARLAPHQRIGGFTRWERGDFPRTNLLKVKRHEVAAALSGRPAAQAAPEALSAAGGDPLTRLRRLLAELSGAGMETITPETDLSLDLNLDSLSRVELAVLLEEQFDVAVEDGDLAVIGSVGELLEVVLHSETAPAPRAFPAWALGRPARLVRGVLQALVLFPLHRLFCRPFRVEGAGYPREVPLPALFIANHSSHVDTPTILRALPRRVRRRVAVAAAADYFYRSRPLGATMSLLLNTFPFSRETAVRGSLEYCGELVDAGWSLLVYPEGTRSKTGRLQPFKSGIGLLATELHIPVVPVAVEGSYAVLPKGRFFPRRSPITVRFGRPITLEPGEGHLDAAARLERAVAELIGE